MTNTSTVTCPECGHPATVVSRFSVAGAPDSVEYLRIRCDGPLTMLVAVHELAPPALAAA